MLWTQCVFGTFALILSLMPQELEAQIASFKFPAEIKRFQSGNILASTRKTFFEIDTDGNKVQEIKFPNVVKGDEKTKLEYPCGAPFGRALLCGSDGVAWMLMEAERIEVEPEKFVEWAYEGYCLASLDSKSSQLQLIFLHNVPRRNSAGHPVIWKDEEGIVIHRPALRDTGEITFRVDTKTMEIKKYVPVSGAKPKDLGVFAIDGDGVRYRPGDFKLREGSDFLIETENKKFKLSLEKDFGIKAMAGLAWHPSGLLVISSNRKEILLAKPDLEIGSVEILHEVELNASYRSICVLGKQDD